MFKVAKKFSVGILIRPGIYIGFNWFSTIKDEDQLSLIIICYVGGSKAPPVLYSPYRLIFKWSRSV